MRWTGPIESAALLTGLPVPAKLASSTRGVLPWAPAVGLVLGGVAAGVAVLFTDLVTPWVGAVLAIGTLALLTRGLHLDGVADTADGLGPLRNRERALQVMRQGDVGPFGVVSVVLLLLLQVACTAALLSADGGWLPLWAAVVVARLAMVRTGLPGVAVAAGSSLGRAVAGTVTRTWWVAAVLLGLGVPVGGALALAGPVDAVALLAAGVAALLAAELVHRRATARLGGTSGDVMGAMAEVSVATYLLTAAALWR